MLRLWLRSEPIPSSASILSRTYVDFVKSADDYVRQQHVRNAFNSTLLRCSRVRMSLLCGSRLTGDM